MAHNLTQADEYIPPELIELTNQVITPKQYERLVRKHGDLFLELTSTGELIIMPPTGLQSGVRNANLTYQLEAWARTDGSGVCFGSCAIFGLPNGARRIPDGAWIRREKWNRLTKKQQERIGPLCPDFVVEIRSPSDRLTALYDKMSEYIENGVSLGWLIDPFKRRVHVYQPGQEPIILEHPETVSGDPVLRGFRLIMAELWGPDLKDLQD